MARTRRAAASRSPSRWIQLALAKHKPGILHRQLGVPEGVPIPLDLLHEAMAHPERFEHTAAMQLRLKRRVMLALNLRKIGKRRKRRRR